MRRHFNIRDTNLRGLVVIERTRTGDSRGYLERLFCSAELDGAGWSKPIAQVNRTHTLHSATVRGLHYQRPPYSEAKLVTCLKGEVFDVAVDLRADSPTFMQWHAETLRADRACALLIPEGFAHGFQTLTDDVEMLYFHSHAYAPNAECGIHPLESRLAIAWPLQIAHISERDASHPFIGGEFTGLAIPMKA